MFKRHNMMVAAALATAAILVTSTKSSCSCEYDKSYFVGKEYYNQLNERNDDKLDNGMEIDKQKTDLGSLWPAVVETTSTSTCPATIIKIYTFTTMPKINN